MMGSEKLTGELMDSGQPMARILILLGSFELFLILSGLVVPMGVFKVWILLHFIV
jgi:hypothetical protein